MDVNKNTLANLGARLVVWVPYLWLIVFFLLPFLIVLKISLSQSVIALPPYLPVFDLAAGWAGIKAFIAGLGFDNFATLGSDSIYLLSYLKSLEVAFVATVILPFWTSFLIRVYAWINILQTDGLLNRALQALGLVSAPVTWLASDTAIYIGIVYSYLPFMVLPLYAALEKMDHTLLEAAADLGASPRAAFWRVTVPLSLPGIGASALLCFIPIIGEFVIPDLLGGSESLMIGQTLWTEFFSNKDWPVASAIAVALLCLLVGPIAVYQHLQMGKVESGG